MEAEWRSYGWEDIYSGTCSYEQDGRFFLSTTNQLFETSELINLNNLTYDEFSGWIHDEKSLGNYIKEELA